ncbi:hypothetical protein DRO97_09560 [Archaeoglobales archaeon]|nr:MAG: hypothetical protein DRO97_09560 [Archaeoglobales archaeon]
MIDRFKKLVEDYRLYSSVTNISSISRRYFVIGFFDGVLTVLGMIMGAHLSGEASSTLIITAGIATALALGISSGWGAFEAERIEQLIIKREKEKAMLKNVKGCAIDKAHEFATMISSIVHGIAPIPAAIIPLIPYVFFPLNQAFYLALAFGLSSLFVVGAFLGKISKTNLIVAGLRMVIAGLVTLIVVTVLSPSHFI